MERKPLPSKRDRYRDREPPGWRWLAAALALAVHGLAWLLLRTAPALSPASPTVESERIRLTWSQREPEPVPLVYVPASVQQASRHRADAIRPQAVSAPSQQVISSVAPIQLTLADDTWTPAPGSHGRAGKGAEFQKSLFAEEGIDAFAPKPHMRELPMLDSSLGGWMQRESQRRYCGELKSHLRNKPESTAAILGSMRRWKCQL